MPKEGKLTVADVVREVQEIEAVKGDNEVAHSMEDYLWQRILRQISLGDYGDASELAAAALKSYDIKYERWYA